MASDQVQLKELVKAIIASGEKAGEISRYVRSEDGLFQRETKADMSPTTLADILIQVTTAKDLSTLIPGLKGKINGEEDDQLNNQKIQVHDTVEETQQMLAELLGGGSEAIKYLSQIVHRELNMVTENEELNALNTCIPVEDIAIWIDPIDSTRQYVLGFEDIIPTEEGVYSHGLQCVTNVIGAYNSKTGRPLVGLLHQPFCRKNVQTQEWEGRTIWGASYGQVRIHNLGTQVGVPTTHAIVSTSSEEARIDLEDNGNFKLANAAGAGYKTLCAIDNLVGSYISSTYATNEWDICGADGILRAMGGGTVSFHRALHFISNLQKSPKGFNWETDMKRLIIECSIRYNEDKSDPDYVGNTQGTIAYRSIDVLTNVLKACEHFNTLA